MTKNKQQQQKWGQQQQKNQITHKNIKRKSIKNIRPIDHISVLPDYR